MVLSKRERSIGIATGIALGAFVLYSYVFDPLWEKKNLLDVQIAKATYDLAADKRVINSGGGADRRWLQMASGALRKDSSEAGSLVLNSVREWAQDSGVSLLQITPIRNEAEKDFNKLTYRAIGNTSMSQISRFLWRIQTADVPVAVTDIQLTSRKDGTDDIGLQLGFATIYLTPESEKSLRPGGVPAPRQEQQ